MGIPYIAVGMIFFFNPNLNIIDVLPDLIGCLLIIRGLSRMADIVGKLQDAKQLFFKLALVEGAKSAALFLLSGMDATFTLVLTFVFAILELIFVLPAICALFDGLLYAGMRYEGEAVFRGADSLKKYLLVFMVLRSALAVLPELTALSMYDRLGYVEYGDVGRDIADYKPVFLFAAGTVCVILGMIALVRWLRYIIRVQKDRKFLDTVAALYDRDVRPKTSMFLLRRVGYATVLMILASLLQYDMFIENINICPDWVSTVIFMIALAVLLPFSRKAIWGIAAGVLHMISSVVVVLCNRMYFEDYTVEALRRGVVGAMAPYRNLAIAGIAESVIGVLFFVILFLVIRDMIADFTAPKEGHAPDKLDAERRRSLRTRNLATLIIGTLMLALSAAARYLVVLWEEIWLIHALLTFVWIVYWVALCGAVKNAAEEKYML